MILSTDFFINIRKDAMKVIFLRKILSIMQTLMMIIFVNEKNFSQTDNEKGI
jgi:hypothetical protein